MANCRKCGKPLVIKDGKCIYCGEPVQGSASGGGKIDKKESFVKAATKSLLSKEKTWTQRMLRKSVISIIVTMVLGILILFTKVWPSWFISVFMLSLSVVLTIYSFLIINLDKEDDEKKKLVQQNLKHGLNIILLWGAFFFILGAVCMFISWWAVMVVELLGIAGIIIVTVKAKNNDLGFLGF